MLTIEFEAPTAPVSTNKANTLHWGARSRLLKPWRWATQQAVFSTSTGRLQSLDGAQRLEVTVHLPFKNKRRRDPHNYVGTNVKALIDGLVDSGLLIDDTSEYVKVNEPVLVVGKSNTVVVYIKEAE